MTRTHAAATRILVPIVALSLFLGALAARSSAEAQMHRDSSRLRLGLQGDLGYVRESDSGLVLGLTAQLGVQHNDLFAVYYQPRMLAGSYFAGVSDGAVVAVYNTVMFDFTLADMVQLGVGPSLDLGVIGVCRANDCSGFGGAFFGADFKAALALGVRVPGGGRSGFVLALHVHPTWIGPDRQVTTVTLGFGVEAY